MVLRFCFFAAFLLLLSCVPDFERDSINDPGSNNYYDNGEQPSSSSSTPPSSSSVSSSSGVPLSSSSSACTAANNTSTQYCSNGVMKTYGSVTDNDGKTYKTVVIGTQNWMAENLNYAVEGSKCGNVLNYSTVTDANTEYCDKYGRLYNWATAVSCNSSNCSSQVSNKHRGICPENWHIPTYYEWDALSSYVESNSGCSRCDAKHLKAVNEWNYGNSLDTYGFAALPGGIYYLSPNVVGIYGGWWSTSCFDDMLCDPLYDHPIYCRQMDSGESTEGRFNRINWLFNVRCIQD